MLDQQDKIIIREIVGEEIDNKTSDLRKSVSILQQDVSTMNQKIEDMREENQRNIGTLMEYMKHNVELILEGVGAQIKAVFDPYKDKVDHHEIRINSLELAVKKKTDLRLI